MNEDQLRQLLAEEANRITPAPAPQAQQQVERRAAQLRRRRHRMISGAGTIGLAAAVLVAVMISMSSKPAAHVVVPTGPATTEGPAGVMGTPDTTLPPEPPTDNSGPTTTVKPGQGRCHTNQLSVTTGPVGAAAGTIDAAFIVTNTSKGPCSVFGYPGFALLDSQGHNLIGDVVRGGTAYSVKPQRIPLKPGQAASFSVRYSDVPTGTATCQTSVTALITPPDETTQLTIRDQAPVCGSPFTVSPVVAGSNGAAP